MRTKIICFTVLLTIIMSISKVEGQTISAEERHQIIANLDSADIRKKYDAINNIIKFNVCEGVPKLEQTIWTLETNFSKIRFLDALLHCDSPNLTLIAHTLIDSADHYRIWKKFGVPDPKDPLRFRASVTYYLIKAGDFSTIEYVFQNLQRDSSLTDIFALEMLEMIVKHVPQQADRAKLELIRLLHSASLGMYRNNAMVRLVNLYGVEISSELVRVCKEDTGRGSNRIMALQFLINVGFTEVHSLLVERLYNESEWAYRFEIADTLLKRFGTPADYNAVAKYSQWESDTTARSLTTLALSEFEPPVPTLPLTAMLDSLISYKNQTIRLHWLSDVYFAKEITNKLDNAKKHLLKKDSVNCYKEVKEFQKKVNEVYEETIEKEKKHEKREKKFVTVEGWKFLYYNAQYIMDRLPHKKNDKDDDGGKD